MGSKKQSQKLYTPPGRVEPEAVEKAERILHYKFQAPSHCRTALRVNQYHGNRKLAILGGRVLEFSLSQEWYASGGEPGDWNFAREMLVTDDHLYRVALRHDVPSCLGKHGSSQGAFSKKTLAKTVEALIGAVFLDGGVDAARKVMKLFELTYEKGHKIGPILNDQADSFNNPINLQSDLDLSHTTAKACESDSAPATIQDREDRSIRDCAISSKNVRSAVITYQEDGRGSEKGETFEVESTAGGNITMDQDHGYIDTDRLKMITEQQAGIQDEDIQNMVNEEQTKIYNEQLEEMINQELEKSTKTTGFTPKDSTSSHQADSLTRQQSAIAKKNPNYTTVTPSLGPRKRPRDVENEELYITISEKRSCLREKCISEDDSNGDSNNSSVPTSIVDSAAEADVKESGSSGGSDGTVEHPPEDSTPKVEVNMDTSRDDTSKTAATTPPVDSAADVDSKDSESSSRNSSSNGERSTAISTTIPSPEVSSDDLTAHKFANMHRIFGKQKFKSLREFFGLEDE